MEKSRLDLPVNRAKGLNMKPRGIDERVWGVDALEGTKKKACINGLK